MAGWLTPRSIATLVMLPLRATSEKILRARRSQSGASLGFAMGLLGGEFLGGDDGAPARHLAVEKALEVGLVAVDGWRLLYFLARCCTMGLSIDRAQLPQGLHVLFGVPDATKIPHQLDAYTSRTPSSSSVGRSGACSRRSGAATASARMRPALTCVMACSVSK